MQGAGDPAHVAIVGQAADLFGTPMAAISIAIAIGASETPRVASFCAHTMLDCGQPFCILDATADARFAGNPLVLSGPEIRFYAGVPLVRRTASRSACCA